MCAVPVAKIGTQLAQSCQLRGIQGIEDVNVFRFLGRLNQLVKARTKAFRGKGPASTVPLGLNNLKIFWDLDCSDAPGLPVPSSTSRCSLS